MKRKKWSELEEQTLLDKYSDLLNSGSLPKLKTREKKFRPIADHVNSVHHLHDPIIFPFKWSWRDVSIKVQNMRHQYMGVKQKIRISKDEFNWKDGENHWENFLKYKQVFGDVELDVKGKKSSGDLFEDCCDLGFGIDCEDVEDEDAENGDECEDVLGSENEFEDNKARSLVGGQVMELREVILRREEKRREKEFSREKNELERDGKRKEREFRSRIEEDKVEMEMEMEMEEREWMLGKKEFESRIRVENELELEEERKRRRRIEEKREEEEMEWRESMVRMQIEHDKTMMQMQADAFQNQMQILGMMGRMVSHFFGSANDGLSVLHPQVLHNSGGKPDSNSPSEFI